MENCKLTRDLLIDILARLSVQTLMRFKGVCRFFYDLIKNDHQFMHKHYEFGRAKNHCAVLEFHSPDYPIPDLLYYLLYKESESSETRCIYLNMPNSKIRCVKCCHGMLCLIVGKGYSSVGDMYHIIKPDVIFDVFALNPLIKALPSIKMPNKPPNKPPLGYLAQVVFGFGLSNNMAWKIIMLVRFEDAYDPNWQTKDSHEIVMVCSQVGDSWNWSQIDAVPPSPREFPYLPFPMDKGDFHLKGKYYWRCFTGHLIWFDLDDEVFGKIEIPFELKINLVTVMNETIALISGPHLFLGDEGYIDIWFMDENNNNINNINWQKQPSIHFSYNINEYWNPIGIWNLCGHLLVFSSNLLESRYNEVAEGNLPFFKDSFGPNLISIDLVTQEKKLVCTSQEEKSAISIGLNPGGYVQICSERNITKAQEWNESNIAWHYYGSNPYARVFNESLKLL